MLEIIEGEDYIDYKINDRIFGQFYCFKNKLFHLAEYIPYEQNPQTYLCNTFAYFTTKKDSSIKLCKTCKKILRKIMIEEKLK